MTTIAFDGKVLAGDGRDTDEDGFIASDNIRKVFRVDEILYGVAGDTTACEIITTLLMNGDTLEELEEDLEVYSVIKVLPNSKVYSISSGCPSWNEVDVPFAIGSGAGFAIGAMLAGKNATDAVKIAAKKDCNTGGKITTLLVEESLKEL